MDIDRLHGNIYTRIKRYGQSTKSKHDAQSPNILGNVRPISTISIFSILTEHSTRVALTKSDPVQV